MKYALAVLLSTLVMLTGCHHHHPTGQSYGLKVITVDPTFDREVGIAVVQAPIDRFLLNDSVI